MDLVEELIVQKPPLETLQKARRWADKGFNAMQPIWQEQLDEAIANHDPSIPAPDPLAGIGPLLECVSCGHQSNKFTVCRHCFEFMVKPEKVEVARKRGEDGLSSNR